MVSDMFDVPPEKFGMMLQIWRRFWGLDYRNYRAREGFSGISTIIRLATTIVGKHSLWVGHGSFALSLPLYLPGYPLKRTLIFPLNLHSESIFQCWHLWFLEGKINRMCVIRGQQRQHRQLRLQRCCQRLCQPTRCLRSSDRSTGGDGGSRNR